MDDQNSKVLSVMKERDLRGIEKERYIPECQKETNEVETCI